MSPLQTSPASPTSAHLPPFSSCSRHFLPLTSWPHDTHSCLEALLLLFAQPKKLIPQISSSLPSPPTENSFPAPLPITLLCFQDSTYCAKLSHSFVFLFFDVYCQSVSKKHESSISQKICLFHSPLQPYHGNIFHHRIYFLNEWTSLNQSSIQLWGDLEVQIDCDITVT